jgi:hypothetical protein
MMINAKKAVSELVRKGAAMVVQPGGIAMMVGVMREVQPGVWWWWEAGCESEFGGHMLVGDPEVFYGGLSVKWTSADSYGYLTTIEEAVDEPSDQERLRAILAIWRDAYESSESLRGFIEREMKRHLASRR